MVLDYLTRVKVGGFYGWQFFYYGQHINPRLADEQSPDAIENVIVPDISLGSHTASLGLLFYQQHVSG